MPCMKRVYRDKKASVHWSAAKNKERFSSRGYTVYQPVVNRGFCSPVGLSRISLVRASGETFRTVVFDALGGRGTLGSCANCSVGVPSCSARPRRPAVRRPVASRPWYVRVLDSTSTKLWRRLFLIPTTARLERPSRLGFPDMPCMKRVYRDKKASFHWSAARNKERFSSRGYTAYQPVVNR